MKDLAKNAKKLKPEEFNEGVDEVFATFLSDGTLVELCPGGKEKQVTLDNY